MATMPSRPNVRDTRSWRVALMQHCQGASHPVTWLHKVWVYRLHLWYSPNDFGTSLFFAFVTTCYKHTLRCFNMTDHLVSTHGKLENHYSILNRNIIYKFLIATIQTFVYQKLGVAPRQSRHVHPYGHEHVNVQHDPDPYRDCGTLADLGIVPIHGKHI